MRTIKVFLCIYLAWLMFNNCEKKINAEETTENINQSSEASIQVINTSRVENMSNRLIKVFQDGKLLDILAPKENDSLSINPDLPVKIKVYGLTRKKHEVYALYYYKTLNVNIDTMLKDGDIISY